MLPKARPSGRNRSPAVADDLVAVVGPDCRLDAAWGPLLSRLGFEGLALHAGSLAAHLHPDDEAALRQVLAETQPGVPGAVQPLRLRTLGRGWTTCAMRALAIPGTDTAAVIFWEGDTPMQLLGRVTTALASSCAEPPTGPTAQRLDAELLQVLPALAAALDADAVWGGLLYPEEQVTWELQCWDAASGHNPFVSRVEPLPSLEPGAAALLAGRQRVLELTEEAAGERLGRLRSQGLRRCHEVASPLMDSLGLVLGAGSANPPSWSRQSGEVDAALRLAGAVFAGAMAHQLRTGLGWDLPWNANSVLAADNTGAVVTETGQFIRISKRFGESVGREPGQLVGARVFDVVADEDRRRLEETLAELASGSASDRRLELRLEGPGGTRWARAFVRSLPLDGRVPLMVAEFDDIDEIKAAVVRERQLGRRYHGLIDALPDPLFLLDPRGSVLFANRAAAAAFGEFNLSGAWELGALGAQLLDSAKPAMASGSRIRFNTDVDLRGGRRHFEVSLVVEVGAGDQLDSILAVMRDRTDGLEVAAQLEHQAAHDALTQLPNRMSFLESLRHGLSRLQGDDQEVGVLAFDLDRFKVVNDSLGHAAGDEVLVEVSRRLRTTLRPSDLLARMGGDEFAVLVRGLSDDPSLLALVHRLQVALSSPPVETAGREFTLSASVGVATSNDPGMTAEELLRRADAAMYRAKAAGPGRADRFDAGLQDEVQRRLEFDERLRLALQKRELRVFFQPDVDLETGKILGAEALLRWEHPDYGLLSLGSFSQVAEDTAMIVGLGRWVLEQACERAVWWRSQLGDGFVLRVNMSARELQAPDVVDSVATTLGRVGYPASALCLELTETALMGNAPSSAMVLDELHALGVSLAIDDFGTGYSSLSYLKRFPVDVVKIDRSFVLGLPDGDDRAIIASVVALADSLGLEVTAEGVERTDQRDVLVNLGCLRGQGYLFAPPVPSEVFDGFAQAARPLPIRANPSATWAS
ncbi:MAG: EAL domain-containing protein [Microthrixaceae bacterium]